MSPTTDASATVTSIRGLVRVTVVTSKGRTVALVRKDVAEVYVDSRRGYAGFVSATCDEPMGFVRIPGGDVLVLDFAPESADDRRERFLAPLDAPATALAMLNVMYFAKDTLVDHVFCMHVAANQAVAELVAADPTIEIISISGPCTQRRNGIMLFADGTVWMHPTTKAWLDKIAATRKRRATIVGALKIGQSEDALRVHEHGCRKFTPETAQRLRSNPNWKRAFENFICTCGHSDPTNDFTAPRAPAPTPAPSPA